jgi:hypothetical protein
MSTMLLYKTIFSITMLVAVWAAVVIWRRRHAPGGTPLFWMMVATLEWNFTSLMQVVVHETGEMIFWSKLAYFGCWSAYRAKTSSQVIYTRKTASFLQSH